MRTSDDSSRFTAKHSVSYGWKSPVTRKHAAKSSRFGTTLLKYVKLYCKYSSLAGFKYIVENHRNWFERILWIIVYLITVPTLLYVIRSGFEEFMRTPIITTVDTEFYPTHKLEFPGVAICTINRISRGAAVEMATKVANISGLTVEKILNVILQLGDLYDSTFMTHARYDNIDEILRALYKGRYDVTDVLKRLTPECSVMLLVCYFHGVRQNCSDIFAFRKTQDGFCCTFNYATPGDDEVQNTGKPVNVYNVANLGVDSGLTVVMEPFLDDYFYTILPISGWKVIIFNPRDYPDMTSGGVKEILLTPHTELMVELNAVMLKSIKSIKAYPTDKRGCIFHEERKAVRATYTYSDCILDCKIDDIWNVCACTPFYYPRRGTNRICNVTDVPCLSEFHSKWFTVIPNDDHLSDTIVNKSWTLQCHHCYPECDDISYVVQTSTALIQNGSYAQKYLKGIDVQNQSIIHAFFTNRGTIALKQDVLYRWYELMSDASGICSVFIGFSLISIVEIVYYTALFVFELFTGPNWPENTTKETIKVQPAVQAIYWNELFPRTRIGRMTDGRNRDDKRRSYF